MSRVAQPVVGAVLPLGDDPLIQQFLQFQKGPQPSVIQVPAAVLGAAAGVAGDELGEQAGHRAEHFPDVALLERRALASRLDVDLEKPAGGLKVAGDEDLPVIADDHLGDGHRPGRSLGQALVQLEEAAVRQHRPGHLQCVHPARPHRLGGDGAGQQHAGVDRLGGRPQHRGGQGAGGDVDHAGQLDLAGHPVVEENLGLKLDDEQRRRTPVLRDDLLPQSRHERPLPRRPRKEHPPSSSTDGGSPPARPTGARPRVRPVAA